MSLTISSISKKNSSNFIIDKYENNQDYSSNLFPKINKIYYMNYMFAGCISLISITDISNWNISNVLNLKGLFARCNLLKMLPDISKWNTSNVIIRIECFSNVIH